MIVDLLEPLGLFFFFLFDYFSPLFCLYNVVSGMDLNPLLFLVSDRNYS